MRSLSFLIFVALAFFCWGVYGPMLHMGQVAMGDETQLAALRPLICVGLAYVLIAVMFPMFVLFLKGETGNWSLAGIAWSFASGLFGALGVTAIVLAFAFNGDPFYVMPLVFGGAPVVHTLVNMLLARTIGRASILFYISILIVVIGATGVLLFHPKTAPENPTARSRTTTLVVFQETDQQQDDNSSAPPTDQQPSNADSNSQVPADPDSVQPGEKDQSTGTPSFFWITACIGLAALCWGSYGPLLHKGQSQMGGSRLRPFLCVGLAFLLVAVVGPFTLLPAYPEPGGFGNIGGTIWALLAGAAAATGALSIIYAFNSGAKPTLVMPLVFGFSPIVNTITETLYKGLYGQVSNQFWISLFLVIAGAVLVLLVAPVSHPMPESDENVAATEDDNETTSETNPLLS